MSAPVSVLILTLNEESDIPGCLDSIAWCDDIHIFDSGSTDRTAEIARARGATVTTHRFENYAAQRNAAIALPFRHEWVLVLDADERPTPALSAEIQRVIPETPDTVSAYRIQRRDFLWGTWLKHAQMTPFYVRLLRPGRARYTRAVNEEVEIDGDIRALDSPLDHLSFSKGIRHWVAKHNLYSTMEAELLVSGDAVRRASLRQALFAKDFHSRRVAQKAIFYRTPARPLIKFFFLYIVRRGFLDGRAGLTYSVLQAFYEYLIMLKVRELETGAP